jgi:hypothetical protein
MAGKGAAWQARLGKDARGMERLGTKAGTCATVPTSDENA